MNKRSRHRPDGTRQPWHVWLAGLPIPVLAIATVGLWAADLQTEYRTPQLRIALDFVSRILASVLIVWLAGRSFVVHNAPGLLLLGCGTMIWAITGLIAAVGMGGGADLGTTIGSLGAWISALCYLAGTLLSVRPQRPILARLWLGVGYALAVSVVGLLTLAAFAGALPVFFVHGQGGTLVRHVVLGSAIIMFVIATLLLREANRASSSSFARWYIYALLLITTGLFGTLVETSHDTALGWVSRAAQDLGGIYMLIAALSFVQPGAPMILIGQAGGEARHRHGVALAMVLAAVALHAVFMSGLDGNSIFSVLYPAVLLSAFYGGFDAGLLATAFSAILVGFFWMEPIHLFSTGQPAHWLTLAVFLLGGTMVSFLGGALHRARARAATAEAEAAFAAERARAAEVLRRLNAALERKVAQRTAQLEHRARQLQKLTLELSQAEDRERQRIAAILHEDLQQEIAGAKFHLNLLKDWAKHDPQRELVEKIDEALKKAIKESRSLSQDLSPAVLHMNDLRGALEWLANRMRVQHGLTVHLIARGDVVLRSEGLTTFLFRAAQEMLFNVVKHAQVNEATVRVRRLGRCVCLCVSDRGQGFNPQELKEMAGLGLLSIRERVELLGGRMTIKSVIGEGSRFYIVVPDGPPFVATLGQHRGVTS
jgi:signal transduction histidine kinase